MTALLKVNRGKSLWLSLSLCAALFFSAMGAAWAQGTGLPLPRFVSLRSNQVYLRAGPAVQYPIEWIYQQRNLPLEVVAEFDTWRKVRDHQGAEGWMHSSMLSSARTIVVLGEGTPLKRTDSDDARPVAHLENGVIARLQRCPEASFYCQVEVRNIRGWLRRDQFWGVHREEFFQ